MNCPSPSFRERRAGLRIQKERSRRFRRVSRHAIVTCCSIFPTKSGNAVTCKDDTRSECIMGTVARIDSQNRCARDKSQSIIVDNCSFYFRNARILYCRSHKGFKIVSDITESSKLDCRTGVIATRLARIRHSLGGSSFKGREGKLTTTNP